jgi:hypothetical protein
MKFIYNNFSCDVDVFENKKDVIIRFYDKSKEQNEEDICDLVIVHSGYGFLCLKIKGDNGLLSGYLDKNIFSSKEMVYKAIEFIENLFPEIEPIYYHIDLVKFVDYIEYNGEY